MGAALERKQETVKEGEMSIPLPMNPCASSYSLIAGMLWLPVLPGLFCLCPFCNSVHSEP